MLRHLIQVYKSENLTTKEQMLSIGGGLMLLRKGITRPGPLGWVSAAMGIAAIYSGAKAFAAQARTQAKAQPSQGAEKPKKKTNHGTTRSKPSPRAK